MAMIKQQFQSQFMFLSTLFCCLEKSPFENTLIAMTQAEINRGLGFTKGLTSIFFSNLTVFRSKSALVQI